MGVLVLILLLLRQLAIRPAVIPVPRRRQRLCSPVFTDIAQPLLVQLDTFPVMTF